MVHPRLSLNQATIRRAGLAQALAVTRAAGIEAIGLWREPVAEVGLGTAAAMVADSGLRVSSLCRGGFVTVAESPARRAAIDDNRRAIEETALLAAAAAAGSAAVLVLVVGGLEGGHDLVGARARVADALAELEGDAVAAGVTLAVEALHPMYAGDRAVVSTLAQALDLAAPFPPACVGVVVDAFHLWWDPQVAEGIARAGREGRIASYQVSDWMLPMAPDPLLSRTMMGEGCIDLAALTAMVVEGGYRGDVEVEIFNAALWDDEPGAVAAALSRAFDDHVGL